MACARTPLEKGAVDMSEENTTREFWVQEPGRGEIRTGRLGAVGADEVVVRAIYSGISRGTEALVFRGEVPASRFESMRAPFQSGDFPAPVKYGYISVGVVESAGDNVVDFVGQMVFCLHPHQDRYVVPASAVTPLPEGVPPGRAVLAANMETAVNAVWDAQVSVGDRVLVIGAGPIGLAAAAMLRHRGIPATVSARHPHQQAAAERLGASLDVGDGYDVVIDAVATSASIGEAVRRARPMGRVGLVGTTWQPAELGIAACMKEIEILPAMTYRCRVPGRDFDEAAAACAARARRSGARRR